MAYRLDVFSCSIFPLGLLKKRCPGVLYALPQEDAQIVEVGSFRKFLGSTTKAEKFPAAGRDDGEKTRRESFVLVNSETPMVATVHITRSY